MKKNEKRYHETVNNKVASVYIQENYLPKTRTFTDCADSITTNYYDYIGICVGNSRRDNNDWWNGDKNGDRVYNKSTGNINTIMAIVDTLTLHMAESIAKYDYYCCVFEPTDNHRKKAYFKMIKHVCKKHGLTYKWILYDDAIMYYITL